MIGWKKGAGIGQSIIMTAFLVFLLIPLFTFMTEKLYLKYVVHVMNESADLAVMTATQEIDALRLASREIGFEEADGLEQRVIALLEENAAGGVVLLDYDIDIHDEGETCSLGSTSDYNFVHLLLKLSVKRMHGNKEVEFYIHRDIEIPCIRIE